MDIGSDLFTHLIFGLKHGSWQLETLFWKVKSTIVQKTSKGKRNMGSKCKSQQLSTLRFLKTIFSSFMSSIKVHSLRGEEHLLNVLKSKFGLFCGDCLETWHHGTSALCRTACPIMIPPTLSQSSVGSPFYYQSMQHLYLGSTPYSCELIMLRVPLSINVSSLCLFRVHSTFTLVQVPLSILWVLYVYSVPLSFSVEWVHYVYSGSTQPFFKFTILIQASLNFPMSSSSLLRFHSTFMSSHYAYSSSSNLPVRLLFLSRFT